MSGVHDRSLFRIDDPELARDMERARMRLLLNQPSLAAAVLRIPVVQVPSDELPAGIGATRGAIVVSQALRLKHYDEIAYAYAHNMVHCLFEHLERRASRSQALWNLVIDIATAALLDPMLDPAARDEPPDCDFRPEHTPEFSSLVNRFGDLSCEQIFEQLKGTVVARSLESRSMAPSLPDGESSGRPSFEGDPHASGHQYDRELGLGNDAELSSEDRALITQEIAEALQSDAKLAGKDRGRWKELARRSRTRDIPWERLFAERLEGLVPIDFQTFPFSKRHLWRGVYLPSIARQGIGRVLFSIDTSGSMSIQVLGQIADQIDQLRQATGCSLTLLHFDTGVQSVAQFDEFADPLKAGSLEMPGRGGTDLRAPFEYAQQQLEAGERIAAIIIATDGCGPLPEKAPPLPVIWLVPEADARNFEPPFGIVIRCCSAGSGGAHAA